MLVLASADNNSIPLKAVQAAKEELLQQSVQAGINQCRGDQLNTAGDQALESLTQLAIRTSE